MLHGCCMGMPHNVCLHRDPRLVLKCRCVFRARLAVGTQQLGAGASCTVQLTGLCSDMDALCARARDVLELLEEKEEEGEEAREHVDTNMFLKARNRHRVRFLVRTQRSSHAHTVQCTTLH